MSSGREAKWYYQPWVVVLLLVLVLGPLGLPLLYKSPKFGRTWKWGLTILTLLYTGYLVWGAVKAIEILLPFFQP